MFSKWFKIFSGTLFLLLQSILQFPDFADGYATSVGEQFTINQLRGLKTRALRYTPIAESVPLSSDQVPLSLEAKLANILLKTQPQSNVIFSIPIVLKQSNYPPFEDGQTNAKIGLGEVPGSEFPIIGMQTIENGNVKRTYQFGLNQNFRGLGAQLLA